MLKRLFIVITFLPCLVFANPDQGFGYRLSFSSLSVDDVLIDTNRTSQVLPFTFFYTQGLKRDLYFYSEVAWKSFKTRAASGGVGQTINVAEVAFGLDYQYRLSRSIKPRFGIGVDYMNTTYSKRYSMDSDGFLLDRYADEKKNLFSIYLNASHYWKLSKTWDIGANARTALPFGFSDIKETSVGISGMYHY